MKLFINDWIQMQRNLYKERFQYTLSQAEIAELLGLSQAQVSKKLSSASGEYDWTLRHFVVLCDFLGLDASREVLRIKFQDWNLEIKQKSIHKKKQKQKLLEHIREVRLAESYGTIRLIPLTKTFTKVFPENWRQEYRSKRVAYFTWYTKEMKKEDEEKLLQYLISML